MPSTRKNFVLTDDDVALLDRFQRELGWSQTDTVRFGLAALRVLLLDGTDHQVLGDGRSQIKLRLGNARNAILRQHRDDSRLFYIGTESHGPAVRGEGRPEDDE